MQRGPGSRGRMQFAFFGLCSASSVLPVAVPVQAAQSLACVGQRLRSTFQGESIRSSGSKSPADAINQPFGMKKLSFPLSSCERHQTSIRFRRIRFREVHTGAAVKCALEELKGRMKLSSRLLRIEETALCHVRFRFPFPGNLDSDKQWISRSHISGNDSGSASIKKLLVSRLQVKRGGLPSASKRNAICSALNFSVSFQCDFASGSASIPAVSGDSSLRPPWKKRPAAINGNAVSGCKYVGGASFADIGRPAKRWTRAGDSCFRSTAAEAKFRARQIFCSNCP